MKYFFQFALVVLALVLGAYAWRTFTQKPTITTRIEWYERPANVKPKKQSQKGTVSTPTPETAKRDTVINNAPCDSLRALAQDKLRPFETVFLTPIEAQDSLGSFTAEQTDSVKADPWTRTLTLAKSYQHALLKLSRVSTTEQTTTINWLATLAAFVLGFVVALFALK